jgi:hypothetical protein
MTTAVLLRSGMMGNYHVPFWRAVEEATPSLTLISALLPSCPLALLLFALLFLCRRQATRIFLRKEQKADDNRLLAEVRQQATGNSGKN